ncbi:MULTISPECIES: lysophospholipid acyltransferase family protein [Niastella]|uniref:Lysophospholipid acyltransferase family protein n=1 Tax=Niastella soli TaxID=2821487 RepID=A0ABS3YS92_9BACT|nr:lysophospholipid acyltransferase family protein [Niastella soli]MBO9200066.1 lysophospholipid acyltransferase family protein [Niastella soli]
MYYIVYGLLYLVSLLPLRVLYILSDGFYLLVYRLLGYRRKVVLDNLQLVFPEKSLAERRKIASKFYHNFIDSLFETIKMVSASDKYIQKRVTGNWEVLNDLYKTGRSCQVHLGHTFNWEWANLACAKEVQYTFLGVYMPIKNQAFDRLFRKIRAKSGTVLIPATDMRHAMMPWRHRQYCIGLVADQAPANPERCFWLSFFGTPTAFVTGPETGAHGGNIPVVFANIEKPSRGRYKVVLTLAEDQPEKLKRGELTLRYVHYLEKAIKEQPDMWLWSHRRWKHAWKEEYRKLWIGN